MRHQRLSAAKCGQVLIIAVLACIGCIAVHGPAAAQSGRKIPKKPANQEPTPSSGETPQGKPDSRQSQTPEIPVIVASDLYNIASSSSILTGIVTEGIMQRLGDVRSVRARTMGDRVNRKEASDAAKKSSDAYVLWFQLRSDSPMGSQPNETQSQYLQYLYLDYVVFTPGTGKQRTTGHVYQRQRGPGGVPFPGPVPRTTAPGAEYSLRWAGRETADRLLDVLGLPHPPEIPH